MQNNDRTNCKYVFVCGLGRSGTSVLGRNIARLENCTGFKNTGVFEDEGQFLQDVYPTDRAYGGAGRYGFDPRAHLTEASKLLTPENALKLRRSWEQYWDLSKTIRVEKTPSHLHMTRFLQAVFPNSYFVVIKRHPVPVSIATQRWKVSLTSVHSLFEHWLHCHELFEQDKKYLKHVCELHYEDYVENPGKYHDEIAAFLGTRVAEPSKQDSYRVVAQWPNPSGLRVPELTMEGTSRAYNKKYFDRWSDLLNNSPFKRYYRYIALKYEPRFAKYGYSLTKGFGVREAHLHKPGKISATVGAVYCLAADACALMVRSGLRSKWYVKRRIKARLFKPLRVKSKHLLQKMFVLSSRA